MSSTCFETEGSSFRKTAVHTATHSSTYKTAYTVGMYTLYHTCSYNRLPEDEPSGSKRVDDIIKIKMLVKQRCIVLVYIVRVWSKLVFHKISSL